MPDTVPFKDREAARQKIVWEGGVREALDYGITEDDMPFGDDELRRVWRRLTVVRELWDIAHEDLEKLLGDGLEL